MHSSSHTTALAVFQQAILRLGNWSNSTLSHTPIADQALAIQRAKDWLDWPKKADVAVAELQLIFDRISLQQGTHERHYVPAHALADSQPSVTYPVSQSEAIAQLDTLQAALKSELDNLNESHWQNLSLLSLVLEKYGSHISYGEPDVAMFDRVKMTAAVAAALAEAPEAEHLCLVAASLSGIQPFIYTIASAGALKSLRARSFLLELVTEEMVRQVLERLNLPRTSVIYTGGGKLYVLAASSTATTDIIETLHQQANAWFLEKYQAKLSFSLVCHRFLASEVASSTFNEHWETATGLLAKQKNRKFVTQLDTLLQPQSAYEPCKVCHRDDVPTLKPLNGDGPDACPTCNDMLRLGRNLYDVQAVVRSQRAELPNTVPVDKISITLGGEPIYYHFFKGKKPYLESPEDIYLINSWDVELYKTPAYQNPTLLMIGNYGKKSETESEAGTESFITAAEMATSAQGINRVGHLRMDVDRLGQIFAQGLGDSYTLPRLCGLSRQMSYFFKVYLNSLAEHRGANLLSHRRQLTTDERKDLLFIYAGGDDLFVSGAWDDVVEFSFDVYQSFRAYTGEHPDITLSAGITLSGAKYPLYQSADDAGEAESTAKRNGRDSLTLFGQTFTWREWIGYRKSGDKELEVKYAPVPSTALQAYLGDYETGDFSAELLGVLPFVHNLQTMFQSNFPKSFVYNLLATATLQEQQLKTERFISEEAQRDVRYFLHLPKIAYTLARLPKRIRDDTHFDSVSSSLKSPYNAPYFRAIATWLDLLNRAQ
ncbi:MAG: type III-A CRISPR-associated protein Cas10/Csm1 [Cyanobacteria bacterium J06555_13]